LWKTVSENKKIKYVNNPNPIKSRPSAESIHLGQHGDVFLSPDFTGFSQNLVFDDLLCIWVQNAKHHKIFLRLFVVTDSMV
jgi:hypothetical protein